MIKISNLFLTLLVLNSIISQTLALKNSNDFKSGLFKFNSIPSGVYEIDIGDNFKDKYIMAYGDFNGDKNTDMITVTEKSGKSPKQTITVNIWSSSSGKFAEWDQPQTSRDGKIVNIIPGDINYDGYLDMVVITQNASGSYFLDFYKQNSCILSECTFEIVDYSAQFNFDLKYQPMAGDFTGSHYFQLMLYIDNQREIVEFKESEVKFTQFSQLISRQTECHDYPSQLPFATTHFSSIVDFSGDCRADLVLHVTTETGKTGLEFWIKTDNQNYCLSWTQLFDRAGADLVSFNFSDINFDGSVDLVALVKESNQDYDLVIMYNKYSVSSSNLCSKFKDFPYEDISQNGQYVQYQQLNLAAYAGEKSIAPTQIRFADINWDGMPDIIITKQVSRMQYGNPVILMNKSCDGEYCNNLKVSAKREFSVSTDSNFDTMFKVEAVNAAFFDINEDGKIDFLINTLENGSLNIKCFFNYISTDAFFLKALGLNGQCTTQRCQSSNYYGSSYQCKVTTIDTDYKTATGVQLSQSAHCPLQLPFVILGLARTNNYIENFTVGLPQSDADTSSRVWTPIIPNSQLIIFPYTQDPEKWEISIFVQPNDALIIVIIVTVIILAILGAIIIYYHRKEKNQDIQGQQEFLKMIR